MAGYDQESSDLTGIDKATLQKWLAAAQQALHALNIGGKPQQVLHRQGESERSVTYTRATIAGLHAYIAELKAALGIRGRGRRAVSPRF